MVQCLSDRGNYFLLTGLPIAVVGYFSVCLSRSSIWLKLLACVLSAQVFYAILAFQVPSVWQVDFGKLMMGTLVVLSALVLILVRVMTSITIVVTALTLFSPVFYHNAQLFSDLLRDKLGVDIPEWGVLIVFGVLVALLLVLLKLSKVFKGVGYVLRILCASLCMFVFVRLAGLEYGAYGETPVYESWETPEPDFRPPPDVEPAPFLDGRFARLGICCGSGKPAGRCPVGLEDLAYDAVLLVLILILSYATYKCRCQSKRRRVAKDGKGKPAPVDPDSDDELTPVVTSSTQ